MNRTTIIKITAVVSAAMLCAGIGILMIPPIVFEFLSTYSSDNGVLEEVIDSPLMVSTMPALSAALLILGLVGLGIHGVLKNKQYVKSSS